MGCVVGLSGGSFIFSRNAGLSLSIETASRHPFLLRVKNLSLRWMTRNGPS